MNKDTEKAFVIGHEKLRKLLAGIYCPHEFKMKDSCPEQMSGISEKSCTECWMKALAEEYVDDTDDIIEEWKRMGKIGFLDNMVAHEDKYNK